jgi:HEPN domain-containing protein
MADADIDRHPAFGYYNFAVSYHVAADLIADQGLRATHPEAPAAFLYYHAIELYLKSVLRLHGVSAKKLQKIGHDFRKLRSRAEQFGLDLQGDDSEILKLMADGDVWSRARYLETGSIRVPTLPGLRRASSTLREWAATAMRQADHPVRMPSHKKVQ